MKYNAIWGKGVSHHMFLTSTIYTYMRLVSFTLQLPYLWGNCPHYLPHMRMMGYRVGVRIVIRKILAPVKNQNRIIQPTS
jgi:uncharacterized protein YjaZ